MPLPLIARVIHPTTNSICQRCAFVRHPYCAASPWNDTDQVCRSPADGVDCANIQFVAPDERMPSDTTALVGSPEESVARNMNGFDEVRSCGKN